MLDHPGTRSFLVVAHSARLLAQSARRGGHAVCTLDLFHDADTSRFARLSEQVGARAGDEPGFDRDDLLLRAARLCPPSRCLGLVYGAGFEDDPSSLQLLARGRALFGNEPELVARLKDPVQFFALLDRLGIAHPETRLAPPPSAHRPAWLAKRRGASGGGHVADAARVDCEHVAADTYFQRREAGRSISLLFLADGRRALPVGISRQLIQGGVQRYRYAGAVGPIDLAPAIRRTLCDAADALVAHTGLVGCNSMDALLHGSRLSVLEINPRPSATADLYDADWPLGLFDAHLRACRGRLPDEAPRARAARAHAIVHAGARLALEPGLALPPYCSDIPRAGICIEAGAPLCTVHAEGCDAQRALRKLRRRRHRLERELSKQFDPEETADGAEHVAPECESWRRTPGQGIAGTARRVAPGCSPS